MQTSRGTLLKLAVFIVIAVSSMDTAMSNDDDSDCAEDHGILLSMGSSLDEKVKALANDVQNIKTTLLNAIERGPSIIYNLPNKDQWNELNEKVSKLLLLQNQGKEVTRTPEPAQSTKTTVPRRDSENFHYIRLTTTTTGPRSTAKFYETGTTIEASSRRTHVSPAYDATTESQQLNISCYEAKRDMNFNNMLKVDNSIYYVITEKLSWFSAKSECISFGMHHLASFDSLNHLQQVATELVRKYKPVKGDSDFWVSASDIGQNYGHFIWADKRTVAAPFWDTTNNDPNNFGYRKSTCVYLHATGKSLCDSPCMYLTRALCQVPDQLARCFY